MNLILETARLRLTPLDVHDVELALEMFTDADVVRYAGEEVMTHEEIYAEMPNWVRRGGAGEIGIWCAADRATGEKYGSAALLPIPIEDDDTDWELVKPGILPEGDIEVGYFLKRTAWGKGFATEICARLLRFAFEDTALVEIVATLDDDNTASRHVLEKCGFRCAGRRRAYAEDSPDLRISRAEWIDRG